MIEPGFPTLLAHPSLSFMLAALLIALGAALAVRAAPRSVLGRVYWERLKFISEVLLALGLIGLAVFAGRITLAADQVLLEQRVQVAQHTVDDRLRDVAAAQCAAAPTPAGGAAVPTAANLTPFNPGVAARELCAIARARTQAPGIASLLDWQSTSHELRAFGARYPGCVDNVFSRNNDCESTVGSASRLAGAVDQLATAMQVARFEGANLLAVHGDRDWGFALAAAFLAAAGMALRIARAWVELRRH